MSGSRALLTAALFAVVLLAGLGALLWSLTPADDARDEADGRPAPASAMGSGEPTPPPAVAEWIDQLCSRDMHVRDAAVELAKGMGSEVVPFLVAALESNPGLNDNLKVGVFQRSAICSALEPHGAAAAPAIGMLERMLRSESMFDAAAAAAVLGAIGPEAARAVPALVDVLSAPPDGADTPLAAMPLSGVADGLRRIGTVEPADWVRIRELTTNQSLAIRVNALAVVLALSPDEAEQRSAIRSLERDLHEAPDVHQVTVALATSAAGPRVLPLLRRAGSESSPVTVRKRAAMALAGLAGEFAAARELLDAELADPDPQVRAWLADALLTADHSPEVRDQAHAVLVGALAAVDPGGNNNVAAILWMRFGEERASRVDPLLRDDRARVRAGAVRALSFDFDHGQEVVRLLRASLEDDSPLVRVQAVAALGHPHLRPADLGTMFLRALQDPDGAVRSKAIERLSVTDVPGGVREEHLRAVQSLLEDPVAEAREWAWIFFVHPPRRGVGGGPLSLDREPLIPLALKAMRDPSPAVAACAVEVLSLIPAEREEGVRAAVEMLQAMPAEAWRGPAEWHIRLPRALARYGRLSRSALEAVIRLQSSPTRPEEFGPDTLARTIWYMGDAAYPALLLYSTDEEVPVERRRWAAKIARRIKAKPPPKPR